MKRVALNRIFMLQVLTLMLLLAPVAGAGYYVWAKHQLFQGKLNDLVPRYARLQGLLQKSNEFVAISERVNAELARLAYPSTQDAAKAGNDAQQRIRAAFAESRLDIIAIQVMPAKQEGDFDRVPIQLRVEGDITGLHAALGRLVQQVPVVYLDTMAVQVIGAALPASTQRLGAQINLTVFRARS